MTKTNKSFSPIGGGNACKNRSRDVAKRQIEAMNCGTYDIGFFKRDKDSKNGGKMMVRTWTVDEIICDKKFKFLQSKNASGEDIFIRPARNIDNDLILIDDLELCFFEQLIDDNIYPIVITETSPNNHQVWLKTGITDQQLKLELSRLIAEKYEGDPASVDAYHFGRLAGFTNQKQKYSDNGKQPFVLLRKAVKPAKHQQSSGLDSLIKIAQGRIDTAQAQHQVRCSILTQISPNNTDDALQIASEYYQFLTQKFADQLDRSRADWMLCMRLYQMRYTVEQVAEILETTSDTKRKSKPKYYIDRTVKKAFAWYYLKKQNADWAAVRDTLYDFYNELMVG